MYSAKPLLSLPSYLYQIPLGIVVTERYITVGITVSVATVPISDRTIIVNSIFIYCNNIWCL